MLGLWSCAKRQECGEHDCQPSRALRVSGAAASFSQFCCRFAVGLELEELPRALNRCGWLHGGEGGPVQPSDVRTPPALPLDGAGPCKQSGLSRSGSCGWSARAVCHRLLLVGQGMASTVSCAVGVLDRKSVV